MSHDSNLAITMIEQPVFLGALAGTVIVVLVAAGALVVTKPWIQQQSLLLRGDGELNPENATLQLLPVESIENDRLKLSWQPVSGADSYQVVFFASSLTETNRAAYRGRPSATGAHAGDGRSAPCHRDR